MNGRAGPPSTYQPLPPIWRLILVAIGTLILCSCQGPEARRSIQPSSLVHHRAAPPSPALPRQTASEATLTGAVSAEGSWPAEPVGWTSGVPLPYTPSGPWAPAGIAQPWPPDEYLADGGDGGVQVRVADNRQLRGLEMQDTVVHYDTPEGRTIVEPSNRVFLYSPRFGAVRQVLGVQENEQMLASSGVVQPVHVASQADVAIPGSAKQQIQTVRQIGQKSLTVFRSRQQDGAVSTAVGMAAFQDAFKPYENLTVLRTGAFDASEITQLLRGTTAAITWSSDEALQVILDRRSASAVVSDQKTSVLFRVDEPPAYPRLRVIKVASTAFAEVGETVDFTVRFDNVGNQVIGNVVIVDSLATRLEYVENSAQCSLPAAFSTQRNEGGSLVLRWEIAQPIEPGQGGILRFTCRVR